MLKKRSRWRHWDWQNDVAFCITLYILLQCLIVIAVMHLLQRCHIPRTVTIRFR